MNRLLAEKIGEYIEVCLVDGKFPEVYAESKDQATLESFMPQYMEWARKTKISAKSDGYQYSRLLAGLPRGKPLKELASSDIERYKLARMGKVSNYTINHELALLSNIYRVYGLLTGVKIQKPEIVKLRVQEKPVSVVRVETFNALYAAAGEHIRRFMLLSWYTGCRPSEILRLQGKHVVGGIFMIAVSKTGKVRSIPVHQALAAIAESCGPEEYLVSYHGRPVLSSAIGKAFARLRKRLNMTEKITPYLLRHTFATDMLDKTDLNTIQHLMGHTTLRMTEKYLHFSSARAGEAIGRKGLTGSESEGAEKKTSTNLAQKVFNFQETKNGTAN